MAGHLTKQERDRIAQLHHQGAEQGAIAAAIGRDPSTISRELQRNSTRQGYFAAQAQDLAEERRRCRPLVRKLDDPELNEAVRSGLAQAWSPEEIAGFQKRAHPDEPRRRVSAPTIYAWIEHDPHKDHWKSFLRRRGKRPHRRRKSAESCTRARIRDRPEVIEQRLRLGDFEGDTILGPLGTGGLVTLVCRRSRFTILTKIQSKDADHVHQRIKQRLKELAEDRRHSITLDNGTEFAHCRRLEEHLGLQLYFADPGCPYQRGTNENTNGLVRQFFPKGTSFRDISHPEVCRVENLLNKRPRACLNFQTPADVFYSENPLSSCD